MAKQPTCVHCGIEAPDEHSNYSLISSSFGWRLMRATGTDGTRLPEWRCPACWRLHRESQKTALADGPPGSRNGRTR